MNNNYSNIYDNYGLKLWLVHAGPRRKEHLQKRDLEKLNLSRRKVRKGLLQLITNTYVVVNPLSTELIRSINAKNREEAFDDCNEFMLYLDNNKSMKNDGKNKKDYSYLQSLEKRYSDERKKKLEIDDDTFEIISKTKHTKFYLADNKHNISNNESKHISNGRKISLNKYKLKQHKLKYEYKRLNRTLNKTLNNRKLHRNNNSNEVISNNGDTNLLIKVPTKKINETKLPPCLDETDELDKNKYNDNSNFDNKFKIMEADSTVSNHKKKKNDTTVSTNNKIDHKIKLNDKSNEYKQCNGTTIIDKIQKNYNGVFNESSKSSVYKKKKKKNPG
ncbi:hypothetical protein M0802_007194 [Mischocyttarus mexicanus]|nr:hypothetical protein M0802_007194 [Mischocyttarus mexicanus]